MHYSFASTLKIFLLVCILGKKDREIQGNEKDRWGFNFGPHYEDLKGL